jgi:GR25 family glycosyltransferase involved in LPS biosynthesis
MIVWIVGFLLLLIFVYGGQAFLPSRKPHVWDIWVINLDKDTERWASIQRDTNRIGGMVHRWPATNGRALTQADTVKAGVGFAMTRAGNGVKENEELRNLGTVGCWMSHKRLLQHLASLPVTGHAGHLIVEDDVAFPPDFLEVSDVWHQVYKHVPTDWDMVYLGITNPYGPMIAPGVRKLETKVGGGANWGTHAYVVRQGSLKTKLLPWLEHMVDAIDEQYNLKFSEWNVYAVEPNIIPLNPVFSETSSLMRLNAGIEREGVGY